MTPEQLVRAIFDEIINKGDVDAADRLMTDDFVDHGPMGETHGVPAFKEMVEMWRAAVPDVRCDVDGVFCDGDQVAWLVRVSGTHTGEMMGVPPTGRSISLLSPNIARVRGDRVAEHWSDQSMFQFLQQIGALEAAPA